MAKQILQYSAIFLLISLVFLNCEDHSNRKIKLAGNDSGAQAATLNASQVLQVTPEQQRSIAILPFNNETQEKSLDWLRRGLADMLVTELIQSPFLNVITVKQLTEISAQNGSSGNLDDVQSAINTAKETNAEIILTGKFYQKATNLGIDVEMIDTRTSQVIRKESVEGESLEQIFSMVNELSGRVRANIRGDLQDIQFADAALEKMTGSVEAYRCYSEAQENIEKFLYADAEKCIEDAIKLDPEFAAGYLRLARVKMSLGKGEEQKEALSKARKYAGKLSERDQIQLELLEKLTAGHYKEYFTLLKEAVEKLPSDVNLRMELAQMYKGFGNLEDALEHFLIIVELAPNRKTVYNELAYVFAMRGDFHTAFKYIDKYRQLAPNEPNPFDSKGELLIMAGQLEEAALQHQTALANWPQFYNSARRLTELAVEEGDFKKALKYSDHALENAPSDHMTHYLKLYRAMVHWRFGQNKKAEKLLKKLIKEDPAETYTVLVASEMYKSMGDTAKAVSLQRYALKRYQKKVEDGQLDARSLDNINMLALEADAPAKEFIPLLEKTIELAANDDAKRFSLFTLALSQLRSGEIETANSILNEHAAELTDLLAIKHYRGWRFGWKYVFEALDYDQHSNPNENACIDRLLAIDRDSDRKDLRVIAQFARARFYGRNGDEASLAREYADLGAPLENQWRVIGPFSAEGISGYAHPFPPEKEIDLNSTYLSGGREVKWKAAGDGHFDGYNDLRAILSHSFWTVGYGLVYAYSPEKRKVQIRLGTDETCKLWLNDDLIFQHYIKADAAPDRNQVTVVLRPGYNKLLLKVTNTDFDWGYYLRITDENGLGFDDITFHSPEEMDVSLSLR